jgi:hypothetical protein
MVTGAAANVADRTPRVRTTPESYLGWERLDRFVGSIVVPNQVATYRFPVAGLGTSELAYAGRIRVERERLVAVRNARLRLQFLAREVNLVLGGRGRVDVLLDGRVQRTVEVGGEPRLYRLLELPELSDALLELRFSPGVSAYAFTFG